VEPSKDQHYMKITMALAQKAASYGEVPIGALIVKDDKIIAQAYNWRETGKTPLAHAEMIAIHRAAKKLGAWRLLNCTLYVNLEPCLMCAGAIVQSRLARVVYATPDPRAGAVESLYKVLEDPRLNHRPQISQGPYQKESSELLKSFFKKLREK
jgi:tRNA(adenine34) deaminase